MAMIDLDLDEFVEALIAKKSRGTVVDEARQAQSKRELLIIADRAVDVAIMNAVLRSAVDGEITKGQVEHLHDLMLAGSKPQTAEYVKSILPDVDDVIVSELCKLEEKYLSLK
jgi:hypothetical protein